MGQHQEPTGKKVESNGRQSYNSFGGCGRVAYGTALDRQWGASACHAPQMLDRIQTREDVAERGIERRVLKESRWRGRLLQDALREGELHGKP